jgi:sarcosine oxidase
MIESPQTEAIVVGLGAMGSAACFQLASRGVSVIGIDRYTPPHGFGSTHGETRVTRLAVAEGAEYVPLVRRSHELWREIEALSGTHLLTQSGGVVLARPASEFFEDTRALAERFEIEHERLSNRDVRERFGMFAVDETTEGYYEPEAGYLRPEAAVSAQLDLAARRGAQLRFGERVMAWSASTAGVTVTTDTATYGADRLVLSAGPWITQLFPEGRDIFAVHRQLLHWFEIRADYEQLRAMPVFVWDFGGDRPSFVHLTGFYGFPAIDGPAGGMKVATESYESTTAPDGRQHPAEPAEIERMYGMYLEGRLPSLGPRSLRTVSCLYTCTAANRFVIDRHPEHDAVLIVSPCSGHGFKHSAAIGEAVAQWVIGGPGAPDLDLGAFALARAAA